MPPRSPSPNPRVAAAAAGTMIALLGTVALALQALTTTTTAHPSPIHNHAKRSEPAVRPEVLTADVLANVTDSSVSRDSCTSTKILARALWTCRDTMRYNAVTDASELPLVVNTAAWTDFDTDGTPKTITRDGPVGASSNGSNPILRMYGTPDILSKTPFYPLAQADACTATAGGKCADGTRTVVWQDSAPMVARSSRRRRRRGQTVAYTWIANWRLEAKGLRALVQEPSYSLYEMVYDNGSPDRAALPTNRLVDAAFWKRGEIGYGAYGRVVRGGWAYLYGQAAYRNTALARVKVGRVRERRRYEYFVDGAWTTRRPAMDDERAWIRNAGAGKQGRFYYSEAFRSFVWIGQRNRSLEADFYLTTAPAPEGPRIEPYLIYRGENGDGELPSYSLQAHPALLRSSREKGIYLTWTQAWDPRTYGSWIVRWFMLGLSERGEGGLFLIDECMTERFCNAMIMALRGRVRAFEGSIGEAKPTSHLYRDCGAYLVYWAATIVQ